MLFRTLYDETLAQAAYLVGCKKTGEAIVFDPQRDVDRYVDLARAHGLRITAVAETHIHADFLSGARELAERCDAMVYVSDEGDETWKYGWLDDRRDGASYRHRLLRHNEVFMVGNIRFRSLHTPGHTPEHLAYEVTDVGGGADEPIGVITGDFVFVGDLGRPDLLETAAGYVGDKETSARRLHESAVRFLDLPDYLQVWPGHGAGSACGKALGAVPQSTVGYERRRNGALGLAGDEQRFVDFILAGQPEPPRYFARMKQLNRDGVPLLGRGPRPEPLTAEELTGFAPSCGPRVAVVDTRPWPAFRDGHLPGSIFATLEGSIFPTVVGSYLQPEDEICLVVDNLNDLDAATRNCVRIGYDRVAGYITPGTLAQFGGAGGKLDNIAEIAPDTLILNRDSQRILDVRTAAEYADASIPGAEHAAYPRLPEHLGRLGDDRPIVVYCLTGVRAGAAASYLKRAGFEVTSLAGGLEAWRASGIAGCPVWDGSPPVRPGTPS
jgi:hydroxyacylglutathione hydrolase